MDGRIVGLCIQHCSRNHHSYPYARLHVKIDIFSSCSSSKSSIQTTSSTSVQSTGSALVKPYPGLKRGVVVPTRGIESCSQFPRKKLPRKMSPKERFKEGIIRVTFIPLLETTLKRSGERRTRRSGTVLGSRFFGEEGIPVCAKLFRTSHCLVV